jgi:hypothetical protein
MLLDNLALHTAAHAAKRTCHAVGIHGARRAIGRPLPVEGSAAERIRAVA